jgi:hypothetical protein
MTSQILMDVKRNWLFILVTLLTGALAVASVIIGPINPDPWDRAVAIGTCGGLAIIRQENGSVWLRVSGYRAYRIEDPDKLKCSP